MFNVWSQHNFSVVPSAVIAVMGAMCHGTRVEFLVISNLIK
jgi:hypothetical protein